MGRGKHDGGCSWYVLVEIGETNVLHHVNIAPLQVEILLGIDFLHVNGVELNCSTGDLSDGASKMPMLQANSPSGFQEDICTPGPPYRCERPACPRASDSAHCISWCLDRMMDGVTMTVCELSFVM